MLTIIKHKLHILGDLSFVNSEGGMGCIFMQRWAWNMFFLLFFLVLYYLNRFPP